MDSTDKTKLFLESQSLGSGMGAVAWAALEMFRRGGMNEESLENLRESMNTYFAKPSDEECNAILAVLERRLKQDKQGDDHWY